MTAFPRELPLGTPIDTVDPDAPTFEVPWQFWPTTPDSTEEVERELVELPT